MHWDPIGPDQNQRGCRQLDMRLGREGKQIRTSPHRKLSTVSRNAMRLRNQIECSTATKLGGD